MKKKFIIPTALTEKDRATSNPLPKISSPIYSVLPYNSINNLQLTIDN